MWQVMWQLAILALATGCEAQGGERCADRTKVTGMILSSPAREPVTADLVVRGVIAAPSDTTIYSVQVSGVDATSAGLDFDNWTATIPLTVLAGQATTAGKVTLAATASTNCGGDPIPVGTRDVAVDSTPGAFVTQLTIAAALPNTQRYLPSSVAASAIVTVTGNPEGAGATATLASSLGTVTPAQVTLSGDGSANAVGYALFAASVSPPSGTAVLTATASGQAATTSIPIVGPPTFAPDGTHVHAGATLRVTVITAGEVASCQATPAAGIHVSSGPDSDLMAGTGGIDQTMDGLVDIDIAIDTPLAAAAQTTLSCRDPFGQIGTAAFIADP
jgi:hypothetical protein